MFKDVYFFTEKGNPQVDQSFAYIAEHFWRYVWTGIFVLCYAVVVEKNVAFLFDLT